MSESISVVIPVYNGEGGLPALVDRLRPVLQDLNTTYQIVFVNDGSRDRSSAAIESLARRYPEIALVALRRRLRDGPLFNMCTKCPGTY